MIERRYTGIAKQGADVVANPILDGSEENLESIGINGTNYKVGGKPFMKFYGQEITETFVIDNSIILDTTEFRFILSQIADSNLPIEIYNKTNDEYYYLRTNYNNPSFYNVGNEMDYINLVGSYSIGGYAVENYIQIALKNNIFELNDEIQIKYFTGEGSQLAEM